MIQGVVKNKKIKNCKLFYKEKKLFKFIFFKHFENKKF